jgi:hypothetical protein
VGSREDTANTFEGKIDEVAVYARALKPDEIAQRYRRSGM